MNGFLISFNSDKIKWDLFYLFFLTNLKCQIPSAGKMLKFLYASIYLSKSIWNLRNFSNHLLSTLAAAAVRGLSWVLTPHTFIEMVWTCSDTLWNIWKCSKSTEAQTGSRGTQDCNMQRCLWMRSCWLSGAKLWEQGKPFFIFLFLVSTSSWIISPSDNSEWDPIHIIYMDSLAWECYTQVLSFNLCLNVSCLMAVPFANFQNHLFLSSTGNLSAYFTRIAPLVSKT